MENDIKPAEIEKTLVSLFESEKKDNLIKSSLFNLIILTDVNEREEYLKILSRSLIKKFPCRIIFIKESKEKGDFINTSVSSLTPDGDNEGFFCEFIEFEVSTSYKERISYLITPHIIPDLPVYLLFSKDPTSGDTPEALNIDKIATRIIFDSECITELNLFAEYIENFPQENTSIGDLNWARFTPWRRLLAKVFSNKEKLSSLISADTITICYNVRATESFRHNKIQATYMQGWIAEKMGWMFKSALCEADKVVITYTSKYGIHKIHIVGSPPNKNLYPGRLTCIKIQTGDEVTEFIRDEKSYHLIKISHSTGNSCEIPTIYPVTKEGTGTSMTGEIYSRETSKDFLASLKIIKKINTGIICS
jgi:glucose-6-phosphate dehydrogenase assembly protein OpcA